MSGESDSIGGSCSATRISSETSPNVSSASTPIDVESSIIESATLGS